MDQKEPQIQLPPLSLSAVQVILQGLGAMPLMQVNDLFHMIRQETEKQLKEQAALPADKA